MDYLALYALFPQFTCSIVTEGYRSGPADNFGAFPAEARLRLLLTFLHSIRYRVVAVVDGSLFYPILLVFPGCVSPLFKVPAAVDVDTLD
jgi:hypothetical protein